MTKNFSKKYFKEKKRNRDYYLLEIYWNVKSVIKNLSNLLIIPEEKNFSIDRRLFAAKDLRSLKGLS